MIITCDDLELRNFEPKIRAIYRGGPFSRGAIKMTCLERESGVPTEVFCGFEEFQSPFEVYYCVREALQKLLLHELDECLYIKGVRVWDPHAVEQEVKRLL